MFYSIKNCKYFDENLVYKFVDENEACKEILNNYDIYFAEIIEATELHFLIKDEELDLVKDLSYEWIDFLIDHSPIAKEYSALAYNKLQERIKAQQKRIEKLEKELLRSIKISNKAITCYTDNKLVDAYKGTKKR